jgi:hypothetical protein
MQLGRQCGHLTRGTGKGNPLGRSAFHGGVCPTARVSCSFISRGLQSSRRMVLGSRATAGAARVWRTMAGLVAHLDVTWRLAPKCLPPPLAFAKPFSRTSPFYSRRLNGVTGSQRQGCLQQREAVARAFGEPRGEICCTSWTKCSPAGLEQVRASAAWTHRLPWLLGMHMGGPPLP